MVDQVSGQVQRAGRTCDARGMEVELLDAYELGVLRRYDVIPADALRLVTDEVGFGLPTWQRRGYFACVLIFVACVVFLVFWKLLRGTGLDAVEWVLWPANLAAFALGAVQFWRSGRRARAKLVCAAMLKHLRCPHCGYDIRCLPTDPADGATVCPECGCAWRLPRGRSTARPAIRKRQPQPARGEPRKPATMDNDPRHLRRLPLASGRLFR